MITIVESDKVELSDNAGMSLVFSFNQVGSGVPVTVDVTLDEKSIIEPFPMDLNGFIKYVNSQDWKENALHLLKAHGWEVDEG